MLHVVGQLEVGACEKIVACRAGVVYEGGTFPLAGRAGMRWLGVLELGTAGERPQRCDAFLYSWRCGRCFIPFPTWLACVQRGFSSLLLQRFTLQTIVQAILQQPQRDCAELCCQ